MSLKLSLKPHERLIVGGAVITNGNARCDLVVENNVAILREKDILSEKNATTPCRRIYFIIQLMYVDDKNLAEHHALYWKLINDVVSAAPSTLSIISQINDEVLSGRYYQALKKAKKLIDYEEEVVSRVRKPT